MKKVLYSLLVFAMVFSFLSLTVFAVSFPGGATSGDSFDWYYIGSFGVNGTTPVPLGARFKGKFLFEFDLHVKANITSGNNPWSLAATAFPRGQG